MDNANKQTFYIDSSLEGKISPNGNIIKTTNSDALSQAFKIWLTSGQGEKIRTNSGGWLIPFLGKPLTNEYADKIKKKLLEGLEKEFVPKITIVDFQVIPNTNKNAWLIYIQGYSAELNVGINTYVNVSNSPL